MIEPAAALELTHELIARAFPDAAADMPAGLYLHPEAALEDAFQEMLAGFRDGEVWLFAYGSLIWRPEIEVAESRMGRVDGWQRRFCLWQRRFRGCPERPGLMLALDPGGSCTGVAYRLSGEGTVAALRKVWKREMTADGYRHRFLEVETGRGTVRALTFIANRTSDRYAGALDEASAASFIAAAAGVSGPSASYLLETALACRGLGIDDPMLQRLQALVAAAIEDGLARRLQALPSETGALAGRPPL